MPKGRLGSTGLAAAIVLLLSLMQGSIARGDNTASCVERMSAYVTELDQLLSKERNWATPFIELNNRYFPFMDCDPDPLLIEASRSRFLRRIEYFPRAKAYSVSFSSTDVRVGFVYLINARRSEDHFATFVNK